MNDFKASLISNLAQLEESVLSVHPDQLREFWSKLTVNQMELIFTLDEPYLLQTFYRYACPLLYCQPAQLGSYCLFNATNELLLEAYDCRLLRSHMHPTLQKDNMRNFLSSLVLLKKGKHYTDNVFEFGDCKYLSQDTLALKVKQGALFKVYDQIQRTHKEQYTSNEFIILPSNKCSYFTTQWMASLYGSQDQSAWLTTLLHIALALFENRIYLAFLSSLSPQEISKLRYQTPVRVIRKPRIKEESTMVDHRYEEISWQSLKVPFFKLKYRIQQTEENYKCFRHRPDPDQIASEDLLSLEGVEDPPRSVIISAFRLLGGPQDT